MSMLSLPLPEIARHFQVRQDVTFLNHGSFGACPRPVFEVYQQWQRQIEDQPVEFFGRRVQGHLAEARAALGEMLHVPGSDLVYVPNATHGINIVARSLVFGPGDEILATDHEYGAVDRTWRFLCQERGATYINQPVDLPLSDPQQVIDQLWAGVTPRTKIIAISHITSPTALTFPVAAICQKAREHGILTVIDGAHAPGQMELDLAAIGADFYTGNCHKWLCSPKGAAFLYARPDVQSLLKPLVVSWGYESMTPSGSTFQDYFGWTGTADPSAYLTVPAAIAFQREHNWLAVREACHAMAVEARNRVAALTGMAHVCPDTPEWWSQMCILPMPSDPEIQLKRLWEEYRIEAPITTWRDQRFVRISVQAYTTPADIDRLVSAIAAVLDS
jgi:isopenicillin-N epimerase